MARAADSSTEDERPIGPEDDRDQFDHGWDLATETAVTEIRRLQYWIDKAFAASLGVCPEVGEILTAARWGRAIPEDVDG